jgi:hypothetical protein
MASPRPTGTCQGCGASPRKLTQIESGEWVCDACLREIRGPKPPVHLASRNQIKELRSKGLEVSADLTKQEYLRLQRQLNPPKPPRTHDELVRVYRRYATLKGWSTRDETIELKIAEFQDDGPVQLAIDFEETGVDHAKHLGYDAESRAAEGSDRILQLATMVAGITYPNEDGTNRMEIIGRCTQFEHLLLIREPNNPYDRNAVKVCRKTGEQLGHIQRELAAEIVDKLHRGFGFCAVFREKASRYGQEEARIILIRYDPGVTHAELAAYWQRWLKPREGVP